MSPRAVIGVAPADAADALARVFAVARTEAAEPGLAVVLARGGARSPRARIALARSAGLLAEGRFAPVARGALTPHAARAWAEAAAPALAAALARLAGCVEFVATLRAAPARAQAPGLADGGRAWLRARAEAMRADRAAADMAAAALARLARRLPGAQDAVVRPFARDGAAGADLAILAPADAAGALAGAAAEAGARLSGPWPPYSFSGVEAAA